MCLLVVASRVVPEEPLLVGANRDEVLDRPATAVAVLETGPPRILGGRDDLSGGTWLAVNEHGVCAGLTNQPLGEAKDPTKRSRGELPLALARHRSAAEAVASFVQTYRPSDYNGAWMLVGDRNAAFFVDFTRPEGANAVPLPPGIHVLENRGLTDVSPKVDLVRQTLGRPTDAEEVVAAFRRTLVDHRIPDGDERANGANCVHLESFGTRSSCLIRVPAGEGVPRLWVADGPPCASEYRDASVLWGAQTAQPRTSGL